MISTLDIKKLPDSGQITLGQIGEEGGITSGSEVSINSAACRDVIGKSANTQMAFSEWHGATADPLPAWLEYVNNKTSSTKIGDSYVSTKWQQVTQLREWGNMYGSPRHANNKVTGDSRYNRIIQHGVGSYDEFLWLVANPTIPTLVYNADGGQSSPFNSIEFNNYKSLSYSSSYNCNQDFTIQWLTSRGPYTRTKNGEAVPLNYGAELLKQKIKDKRKKR